MNALSDLPLFRAAEVPAGMESFWKFHDENPAVYALLVRLTREAKDAGRKSVGIKALYERARWEFDLDTTTTSPKLNNNYTPDYARLIMIRNPDLDGMFQLRERRTA